MLDVVLSAKFKKDYKSIKIISAHTDVWVLIFGQADGTICKQGVRRELCGVAVNTILNFSTIPLI